MSHKAAIRMLRRHHRNFDFKVVAIANGHVFLKGRHKLIKRYTMVGYYKIGLDPIRELLYGAGRIRCVMNVREAIQHFIGNVCQEILI